MELADDDPLKGWRRELAALETVLEAIEPLPMEERLRVMEVVSTTFRHDDLAASYRAARMRLFPPPRAAHG
jgi:hypothetical protein